MLAAPGSPPELTGSKSSKSSSFRSSSHDSELVFTNVSDFEEIGLDDHHLHTKHSERAEAGRPVVTKATHSTPTIGTIRNLTGQKRPGYPQTKTSGGAESAKRLGLVPGPGMRRGFTSPSTPSLRMTIARKQQSRSPSPTLPKPYNVKPASRRGSWQPNKKSVEELEEECHDSDEDVPDDAVIWNVPISPRPPHERTASTSPSSSTSPSHSPTRLGVVPANHQSNPQSSPSKPNFSRGSSLGSFPLSNSKQPSKIRAKSWTAALSELSEEVKSLTEALEVHAELGGQEYWTGPQRTKNPKSSESSHSKTIDLPPLRKSNVMIDPLPISKEKEAVLTRTRPSWLPPKSQKEEKKHLREYQKMMLLSQEAERKRVENAAHEAEALEAQRTSLARIWEEHVIPNWSRAISEPRTRELWWRGISPQSRGEVWSRAIGNDLSLTAASYNTALSRARAIENSILINESAGIPDQHAGREGAWYRAIRRDAVAAWPSTNLFGQTSPLHDALIDLCMAYSAYRSDVGYIHGTHLIASLLLLNFSSTESAFVSLANLLNRPLPLSFLTADPSGCERAYALTLQTLSYKHPRLYSHLFETLLLRPEDVLEAMFRTLFCVGTGFVIGLEEVCNVWDVLVFEGDKAMIRAAVAVMSCVEQKALGRDEDEIKALFSWNGQDTPGIGIESFMKQFREAGKEDRGRSPAPIT